MNDKAAKQKRILGAALLAFFVLAAAIGLLAAADDVVEGDGLYLDPLPTAEATRALDLIQSEWHTIDGSWEPYEFDTLKYHQTSATTANAIAYYTDWVEDDFQFQIDVIHDVDKDREDMPPDVSYGIAFNIDLETGQPPYVARFDDIADEIQWGHLTPDGDFVRQDGYAPPGGWESTQAQTLAVDVAGDQYTVQFLDKKTSETVFESQPIKFQRLPQAHFGLYTDNAAAIFAVPFVRVGVRPTPVHTPTSTATPTLAPTSTFTPTLTPTDTPIPTNTPIPTSTPTGPADQEWGPHNDPYDVSLNDADKVESEWRTIYGNWPIDDNGGGLRYDNLDVVDGAKLYKSRPRGDYTVVLDFKIEERGADPWGGVLFNAPNGSSADNVYFVRFNGDRTLSWGYFENRAITETRLELRDKYLTPATDGVHRIKVDVATDMYTVSFNDIVVQDKDEDPDVSAEAVRFSDNFPRTDLPYFGLYGSRTKALFSFMEVKVSDRTRPDATETPTPTNTSTATPNCYDDILGTPDPSTPNPYRLTGNQETVWLRYTESWPQTAIDDSIRHTGNSVNNTVSYYPGCVDGDYTLEVRFRLEDIGHSPYAGIAFNANDRESNEDAQVVRFNGDHLLEWGRIAEDGSFIHAGDHPLTGDYLNPCMPDFDLHCLAVEVTSDRYTIFFNEYEIEETAGGVRFSTDTGRVRLPYSGLFASHTDAYFYDLTLGVREPSPATSTATVTHTPTPTETPTPTKVRTNTPGPSSTPTITQTPTWTATSTPVYTPTPLATSPLPTPTPNNPITAPTAPPTQPPTPNTVATSTAAAMLTQTAMPTLTQPPSETPTLAAIEIISPTVVAAAMLTATPMPTGTETSTQESDAGFVVVTATFTPTQRPIVPPTPTPTPDRVLFFTNIVDSAFAVVGLIWLVLGSMGILVFLGILFVLGIRRQEDNEYDLIDPPATPSDPLAGDQAPPPLPPPQQSENRDEPPDDWPPSLP